MLGIHRFRVSQGFSLVEIIVVLLLLGLVSGIAVPRLTKLVDTLQRQNQINDIKSAIQAAPLSIYIKGENTELSGYLAKADVLPVGWNLVFPKPITIRANGVCLGGAMKIIAGNKTINYRIVPPLCRVEDA